MRTEVPDTPNRFAAKIDKLKALGWTDLHLEFCPSEMKSLLHGKRPNSEEIEQVPNELVTEATLERDIAHGEVPNPVLHLYAGQWVAECPYCKGELSKEMPILAGSESEEIGNRDGIAVVMGMINDPRPKCPHCYGRFELVIHSITKASAK